MLSESEWLPQPQTSLEILDPPTTAANAPQSCDSAQAQELMNLTHVCVQDVNLRTEYTSSNIPSFIAHNFKSENAGHPEGDSYQEFLALHREFAEIHPEYHVEVVNASIDMDERSGHASVFTLVEIRGRPKDTRRGAVLVWKWRKRFGRWVLFKQMGIRGMCGILEDGHV